jgi:GT2 family glycosyltransferase
MNQMNLYKQILTQNTPERDILFRVPWKLDAFQHKPDLLSKSLLLEAERFFEIEKPYKISIITPMYNTSPNLLSELIASVRLQSYPHWELLLRDDASSKRDHIKVARNAAELDSRIKFIEDSINRGIGGGRDALMNIAQGDYFIILDHDDLIHPQSLGLFIRSLMFNKKINFIFTNEAKINEASTKVFDFISKPTFDKFTLLRTNYICHMICVSRHLVDTLRNRDGYVWSRELDGAEDHDFFIRLSSLPEFNPFHIPLFTYYWRSIPGSTAISPKAKGNLFHLRKKILSESLDKLYGINEYIIKDHGEVDNNSFLSVHPKNTLTPITKILVIIPFRNNSSITINCLEHLTKQDALSRLKVILVNNNSEFTELETIKYWISTHPQLDVLVEDYTAAFNFAKINNYAFFKYGSMASFVLFLNNDVDIITPHAISTMAAHLKAHEECGFVGIRLMYPDEERVQHGGIKVRIETYGSGYPQIGHAELENEFVYDEHVCLGVTFACAMTRRETFQELGGLEEIILPNGFGDVDISLRVLELGKVSHYYGTLVGIHHESKSRGYVCEDIEFTYLYLWHGKLIYASRIQSLCFNWQLKLAKDEPKLLRHRIANGIADRLNDLIKQFALPLHRLLKKYLRKESDP